MPLPGATPEHRVEKFDAWLLRHSDSALAVAEIGRCVAMVDVLLTAASRCQYAAGQPMQRLLAHPWNRR